MDEESRGQLANSYLICRSKGKKTTASGVSISTANELLSRVKTWQIRLHAPIDRDRQLHLGVGADHGQVETTPLAASFPSACSRSTRPARTR